MVDEPIPAERQWMATLELRVATVEGKLDDIKDDIKEQKLEQKTLQLQLLEIHKAILGIGKPQYTVISGFALVVLAAAGGLWTMAVAPLNEKLANNKDRIIALETEYRSLDVEKENRTDIEGLRSDLKAKIEELTNRLRHQ